MTVIKQYSGGNWVPVAVGEQGPEGGTSTLTTKGDLLTRDSSTVARLAASGTDGLSLVTDSTQSTGLKYEQRAKIVNTDGDPGVTIYVGSVDPTVSYSPATGDVWIEAP